MDQLVTQFNEQPVLALSALIAAGMLLGRIKWWGISLGASGVLFAAMLMGHWGVVLPKAFTALGVVLFTYSVGLQAGPHFVRTVKRYGLSYLVLAVFTLGVAWIAAFGCAKLLGINAMLTTGIYTGALTSTPGLAASLQTLKDPTISVGYGVAYPLGVIGVVLFVQVAPRVLKIDWQKEIERSNQGNGQPSIEAVWLRITNPQIEGKTIGEVEAAAVSDAVISRVIDTYVAMTPQASTRLCVDQHVRIVGTEAEIDKLELLLGPREPGFKEPKSVISSATLIVTEEAICGKSLESLHLRERHGVTISRIWRDEFEFVPQGRTTLQFGDEVRVVGDVADLARIEPIIGHQAQRLNETPFLPFALGLLAGVVVGDIPITLSPAVSFKLGMAGGPLTAGLIAGHFGRIAKINFRMPVAARRFVNDLGLILFLGGAGCDAGASFWEVIQSQGASLLLASAIVTIAPLAGAWGLARYAFRWDALNSLGAVCGAMTSTPGLGAVTRVADSSAPSTAYVAVYPVALLAVTLLAPLLGKLL
ncbi:Aspartate/alanine antiporter [Posidoniimonas polymericola]|uniref:Aspartate/alanine antiporter n=1 Tax=Posidoniimonas polymericola TaxID=2528002 RepID=A0A5C5YUN7_9BACT|nr:TrkA C-terminal domain-containing protein [Posidoniimonas polymericola]TWT78267.1 Aspartate/alanine antiporter [Posidoniimonas polymericola]